jgi:Rnl2 family RNA ligase
MEKMYFGVEELGKICREVRILQTMPNLVKLQVYGELFGGMYPHKNVEKVPNVGKIQNGIYYHPDIQFMIFDATYTTTQESSPRYFDYDVLINYLVTVQLKFCPILKRGKLDDLLKLDPYFQTTIPDLFGLPKIENNFAEGYVIKPTKTIYLPQGSRLSLKLKRDSLAEIDNREIAKNSTKNKDIKTLIFSYLNENRLSSVKSKLTDQERKDKLFVINKLVEDAWIDINKDHTIEFDVPKLSLVMKSYCEKLLNTTTDAKETCD